MPGTAYVRVVVVQPKEVPAYTLLVARLGRTGTLPCTLILELPENLDLSPLGDRVSEQYQIALTGRMLSIDDGVGYARLCIQLVAHSLGLNDVWMLDDSIQDCWQLDLEAESLKAQPPQHAPLRACSFHTVMSSIEQHVAATRQPSGMYAEPLFSPDPRKWDPAVSPRAEAPAQEPIGQIGDAYDFSGSHCNVGIIGLNRQPFRHRLVGASWDEGRHRGPGPFKITHSVYCFFLLNVKATCSQHPMVLWPARQYAEDIEMHHLCEDNNLSVLKWNSLFFHKANLQGRAAEKAKAEQPGELPQVSLSPSQGPMWGTDQVTVTVRHVRSCTKVTVCGIPATETQHEVEGERVYTVRVPPVSDALAAWVFPPAAENIVLSGCEISLEVGRPEPFGATVGFSYQGLWKWDHDTKIRQSLPSDTGRHGID